MEKQADAKAVETYLKLFLAFQKLPETKRNRTLLEVSGYPHYENVASNILAFYFNPAEEHGLKELLLSAFFQMAGIKELPPMDGVEVLRETGTDSANRIDLIIENEAFTIGIENKIFHWLANDLEQYAQVIDRRGYRKNIVIKALLGLNSIPATQSLKGGFTSYTYTQLWQQVRAILGQYIANANPRWVTYLIDFMETTTNLAGHNMDLKRTDQFFIEHNDLIEQLLAERNAFLNRLNQKVTNLRAMIAEAPAGSALSQAPWVYKGSCVVLDFQISESYAIAFDLYLKPLGWELQLFGRNRKSTGFLHKLIGQPALQDRTGNALVVHDRYIVQTWSIQTDLGEIRDEVCAWIEAVREASKTVTD